MTATSAISPRPLRVALDVRMPAGQWGGVQQLAQGLARGLSAIEGPDEFLFLGYADAASWLDPVLGGRARRVEVSSTHGRSARRRAFDAVTSRSPALGQLIGRVGQRLGQASAPIPRSDGRLEALGVDVMHFVTPQAYRTDIPSLYQPLDLLHVHVPEQFSPFHRDYRERAYRAFCEQAACVVSMTEWGRSDLASHFGLDPSAIAVVPVPPVVMRSAAVPATEPVAVPDRFLLYPAQTWPHKNHLGLVAALAVLRDRGSSIHVVCTGRMTEHHAAIARQAAADGVADQISFLGYIDDDALGVLYGRAAGLVFPSRFEGWGLPVVEAFASDLPVTCSDIPVLREVAGDAALLFDPSDPSSMADAVTRIWSEESLRNTLRAKGRERVSRLTWERTARTYRALYRQIANAGLTDEDRALLRPPTLVA